MQEFTSVAGLASLSLTDSETAFIPSLKKVNDFMDRIGETGSDKENLNTFESHEKDVNNQRHHTYTNSERQSPENTRKRRHYCERKKER